MSRLWCMGDGCALTQTQNSFSFVANAEIKNIGKAITAQTADREWTEMKENRMERKAEMHAQICSELHELYEAKNADYGDAFSKTFDEYGMVAPLLRLEDKLSRLKSLHRKGVQQVKQESMRDTLIDLANYAIMTVMELDSQEESRWE